jgi:hypothetical protein
MIFPLLDFFGQTSRLKLNCSKCTFFPIRCEAQDLQELTEGHACILGSLTCTYLGLPLHWRNPRRIDYQTYIDKVAGKLKPRKITYLNRKGRLTLIYLVLTSTLTYLLMIFDPPIWLIKKIEWIRRNFLWASDDIAFGANCMVNWKQICSPKNVGGLGIKNLKLFSRALRFR